MRYLPGRVSAALFLLIQLVSVIGDTLASDGNMSPEARVSPQTVVFETAMRGTPVSGTFILENIGTAPLLVQRVEFSEPGMSIKIKQSVGPKSSESATVTWDTSRRSGLYEGHITLLTNDPEYPRLTITLVGKVLAPISVLPRPALFISQFSGEKNSYPLVVQNNQAKDVLLTRLEPRGEHFQANLKTLEEGKKYEIFVTVPEQTPIGKYQESLLVHTDDVENKTLYIAVNVLVKPEVFVSSETVDLGQSSLSLAKTSPRSLEQASQTFVINRKQGEMAITGHQSDIEFLTVEIEPPNRSNGFLVTLGLDPERLSIGRINGRIVFKTDDPDNPELAVSVIGEITE